MKIFKSYRYFFVITIKKDKIDFKTLNSFKILGYISKYVRALQREKNIKWMLHIYLYLFFKKFEVYNLFY